MKIGWRIAAALLCCASPAPSQQSVCRDVDKDSYRLEALSRSEIADRDTAVAAEKKAFDAWMNSDPGTTEHDELRDISMQSDAELDRLAMDILAAHGITFASGNAGTNYGNFLVFGSVDLYGLDPDKKFVWVHMVGNFLLMGNFTERQCKGSTPYISPARQWQIDNQ